MSIKVPIDAPDEKEGFISKMKELFPAAKPEDLEVAWKKHSEKGMTERIVDVMNDYGEKLMADLQKSFEAQMQAKVKEQEKAMIEGIMKGLGLDKEQPVYLKDVESIVRKIALEGESKKKTQVNDEPDNKGDPTVKVPFDFQKKLDEDLKSRGGIF